MRSAPLLLALGALIASTGCSDEPASPASQGGDHGGAATTSGGIGGIGGDGAANDGGGGATSAPEPGNAMLASDGTVVPLYRITDAAASARAVGFVTAGTVLRALDEEGTALWEKEVGAGQLFGGFDFDADGWPDLGLVRTESTGKPCGTSVINQTWIDLVRGSDGALYPQAVAPLEAKCWTFPGTTYPTEQWTVLDVLFGAGDPTLALVPYYADVGWFYGFANRAFTETGDFFFPSTPSYDTTYVADQPEAHGTGTSYFANSHVANGMLLQHAGATRLLFFTSGRVVQYALGPHGPDQLVADTPYLTAGRTDLVGRNYGLVLPDPEQPDHVALVSGSSAFTVFTDMTTGKMESDPWGQIERHVSVYDVATAKVVDRFFSYAHDGGDAFQYEGRVVYPDGPMVRTAAGQASRLAFNVYEGGHWRLHVTVPGGVDDAKVYDDLFLWDIRDVDRDGTDDWVLSPSRDPEDPDVPGYYFVKWRTRFAHWDEAALDLVTTAEQAGVIPYLYPTFRSPTRTTSQGNLYPVLTVRQREALVMLTWTSAGAIGTLELAP